MRRNHLCFLAVLATLSACKDSPTSPPNPATFYLEGEIHSFNVNSKSACESPDYRSGRVVAVTKRAVVIADTANPKGNGTFSDADYRTFASSFDDAVWPTITAHFGEPHDVDGNGRVILFFTRAVNELTPRAQSWYVGGFFFSRDLFPKQKNPDFSACAGSNEAEILYLLVPDPNGTINGNSRTIRRELGNTVTVMAHEFQHLINASRRLFTVRAGGSNWSEETWLNEGLSHVAEELMTYSTSSLAPRQNIDAERLAASGGDQASFNLHQLQNVSRYAMYLEDPEGNSLLGEDSLATRGAAWSFLRYAADRRGGNESSLWRELVASRYNGTTNLQTALGVNPHEWMHDWLVSLLVDDVAAGVDRRFQQPSWNHRSIFGSLRDNAGMLRYAKYPLRTHVLLQGQPISLEIAGGSGAFVRFSVQGGTRAELRMGGSTAGCTAATTAALAVGEVHRLETDGTATLCVQSGTGGAEYALVPFSTSIGTSRTLFTITGSAIGAAELEAVATHRHAPAPIRAQDQVVAGANSWEAELRERERQELGPLVHSPGSGLPNRSTLQSMASTGSPTFRLALIRTR
jgi:hypothetical protein